MLIFQITLVCSLSLYAIFSMDCLFNSCHNVEYLNQQEHLDEDQYHQS